MPAQLRIHLPTLPPKAVIPAQAGIHGPDKTDPRLCVID